MMPRACRTNPAKTCVFTACFFGDGPCHLKDEPKPLADNFNGDTPHLIRSIEALLRLDHDGALSSRIPGHARKLLEAAAVRLAKTTDGVQEVDRG